MFMPPGGIWQYLSSSDTASLIMPPTHSCLALVLKGTACGDHHIRSIYPGRSTFIEREKADQGLPMRAVISRSQAIEIARCKMKRISTWNKEFIQ